MLVRVGTQIREARQRAGLTLKDLAAHTGVSISMISAVERGERNVSIDLLKRLTEALDLSLIMEVEDALQPQDRALMMRIRVLLPHLDPALRATLELLIRGWENSESSGAGNCQEIVKAKGA